jgi:hypothetical protein
MAVSVQAFQRRTEERQQQQPEESAIDKLLKGLQIAGSAMGLYTNLQQAQAYKQQQEAGAFELGEKKAAVKAGEETQARALRGEYTPPELENKLKEGYVIGGAPKMGEDPESVLKRFVIQNGERTPIFLRQTKPVEMQWKASESAAERAAREARETAERATKEKIAKWNNENKIEAMRVSKQLGQQAKKQTDAVSKSMEFKKLAPEDQKSVLALAGTRANVQAIKEQINANMIQWDKAENDNQRLDIGRKMIKLLNSTQGADAVGAEEAKRLAGKLEFAYGNFLDSNPVQFGRDLEGFREDIENTRDILAESYDRFNSQIDAYYGRKPAAAQPTARPQLTPAAVNPQTGRTIYQPGKR